MAGSASTACEKSSDDASSEWRELITFPYGEEGNLLEFCKDGKTAYVLSSLGRETTALVRMDVATGDVIEEIRFRALAGGRGVAVVSCSNTAMTYDDFAAGFAQGSLAAFKVEPSSGVLNGARGEPTEFKVTVDGSSLAGGQEYEALLVVDTEEDKFTYKLVAEVS